jgi:2-polyprenyl-3-methyl-5-hydroxy-6-metoxy-1,4-benzoquinol methylase
VARARNPWTGAHYLTFFDPENQEEAEMTRTNPPSSYVLGSTQDEHGRLIRQAALFGPITERFFRDAGIRPGQRVLDIGSGLGDVSMLVARLVGPSGAVIGIDNDPSIVTKAKARVAEAGLPNVTFTEADVGQVPRDEPFDAVVGRLILEFLPDPGTVVRELTKLLRRGGILAIQDAYWAPFLQLSSHLPLRSKCASLIHQAFQCSGAHMDMELVLYRTFQEAGLPAPAVRIEVPVGEEPEVARWAHDLFCSLYPRMRQHDLPYDTVGDLGTLRERLDTELAAAKTFGACIGLVSARSEKP